MTVNIKVYLFPLAGGTSRSYACLLAAMKKKLEEVKKPFQLDLHAIDLPGRLSDYSGSSEIISDIPILADEVISKLFLHEVGIDSPPIHPYILVGHSYGAILAFEIAKKVKAKGIRDPLALFVSACRAPSSSSLTSGSDKGEPVSQMDLNDISNYLRSKGSLDADFDLSLDEEILSMISACIQADYIGLETYIPNKCVVSCPLTVIGGECDPIVSPDQLISWKAHASDLQADVHIMNGKGHFYLTDEDAANQMASIILDKVSTINKEQSSKLEASLKEIYSSILNVKDESLSSTSDFFELGGSSLDTIALIAQIEAKFGIILTQNEFFLSPNICELSFRIQELKESSKEFPKLSPLPDSNEDGKWFPASHSQEQMIVLWESSPSMYNMTTTIKFKHDKIRLDILHKAFNFVVEQQPTLRTIVKIQGGNKFMQCVLPISRASECFEIVVREAKNFEELSQIIRDESHYVFPLYDPPIVRGVVIKNVEGQDFLFLSQYHIGSDSWALVILRKQILEAYSSLESTGGVKESLKMPHHPNFVDWTIWQRKCLHNFGQEEKQLSYWVEKLHSLPRLQMPLDKPRPSILGNRGLQIPIKIPVEIIEKFNDIVTSYGANLYAGLLTVYMCILQRMGGGNDFAVGIALANRNVAGLHNIIGYFANEVTIRTKFQELDTFATLLQQVRKNVLEGMANADVAFHDVVRALNCARDSSSTPLFQAFFALQERKWWTLEDICSCSGETKFELKNFSTHLCKFEVHMFIRSDEFGGIEGELTIATDLFEPHTGHRIAEMFHILVEKLTEAPRDASIYSHNLCTKSDMAIITKANKTEADFESPFQSVLDWRFNKESDIALILDGALKDKITFKELNSMVSQILFFIIFQIEQGKLEENSPVGILMKSTVEGIATIYGVLLSGCSIVVVDPEKTTVERSEMIFVDAGVNLTIIDADFLEQFEPLSTVCDLVSANEALEVEVELASLPPIRPISPENVFGYFYTSGTTGKPKGVVIKHGNVLNLVNWWAGFFSLKQSDRVLLFSSLSFIMSLRQYIPTLCAGGTVVLPKSSVDFESAIINGEVNKLICTPSALGVLDIDRVADKIEAVQVAGEAPRLALMCTWKPQVKHLYIGLGPTELCAHGLCGEFDGKTICIGYPVANCKAYIVHPQSISQAPINVVGELWVSGDNVSHGYLNMTTTSYFEDPFENSRRCYKTGDLARRLPDGRIQFLGRADTQLKVNGLRIEAGEIINAIPKGLKNAHVLSDGSQLIMYKTREIHATDLKSTLESRLPKYMVPTKYFSLDSFPLNKNKKLDVSKLVELGEESVTDSSAIDCTDNPVTALENTIKCIWSESLGLHDISLQSNFFDIGGTSLSAVLVCRALYNELEIDIAVQDVFAYPTIASFAKFIGENKEIPLESGDPRPLNFLRGGKEALHPIHFHLLQGIGLALMSIIVFVPFFATVFLCARSLSFFGTLGSAFIPGFLAGGAILHMFLVFTCKWALIGKYREGKAVLFSSYFLKWWLMRRIMQTCRLYSWAFDDTNLSRYFYGLFGAKIGKNFAMENAFLLEPDLVSVGDDCTVEFEAQFCTSCVQNGILELRSIRVGDHVKVGTRSILLGGCQLNCGCEVAPKSTVDYFTSSTDVNQYLIGSPAKIKEHDVPLEKSNRIQRAQRKGVMFTLCQILCDFLIVAIFTGCLYVGALIALFVDNKFGTFGLVLYMMTLFLYICGLVFLATVALFKRILLPQLEEGKLYSDSLFLLKKWFMDRLFLSPVFTLALSRCLETTTTYPLYLRLLGANLGKKVWLSYIQIRVGVEFLNVGDGVHTGMQTYITTANNSKEGTSFHSVLLGDRATCGQRSLILPGACMGKNVTVGAETCVPPFFEVQDNGTILGSPPLVFNTSKSNVEVVAESQQFATSFHSLTEDSKTGVILNSDIPTNGKSDTKLPFWLYGICMNLIQLVLPLVIIGPFIAVYYFFYGVFSDFAQSIIGLVLFIPLTFIVGSIVLMGNIKIIQLIFFGGSFSTGTIEYYSVKFMQWYILADLVYLCTGTILVPFSGTELFCIWVRIMGSKIGKRVFISPENGGFRELDFLNVGDDCCILSPNLSSHYADHGIMQFCPVTILAGCEVNFGATIMPLTSYGKKCIVAPFAVTTKGQHLEDGASFVGNPCKVSKALHDQVALIFGGLGSSHPGMLTKEIVSHPNAMEMLQSASNIVGFDVQTLCDIDADPRKLQDERVAQIIVTVVNLLMVEAMKQTYSSYVSRARIIAGFSVGEFAALCYSGAISFEDTMKLVKVQCDEFVKLKRKAGLGSLCNIRGLSRKEVKKLCNRFKCTIANIVCDNGKEDSNNNVFVCGGLECNVNSLIAFVHSMNDPEKGISPTSKKLRVNTANHTALMKPAVSKFRSVLARTEIKMPKDCLVYSNVTGQPYRSVEEIRRLLPLQMIKPVQWNSLLLNIYSEHRCRTFIDCSTMQTQSRIAQLVLGEEIEILSFGEK